MFTVSAWAINANFANTFFYYSILKKNFTSSSQTFHSKQERSRKEQKVVFVSASKQHKENNLQLRIFCDQTWTLCLLHRWMIKNTNHIHNANVGMRYDSNRVTSRQQHQSQIHRNKEDLIVDKSTQNKTKSKQETSFITEMFQQMQHKE